MKKKIFKIVSKIFMLVAMFASLFAFIKLENSNTINAYSAPSGYSLDTNNIDNLTSGQSYGGLSCIGDKTYSINSAEGFITLARLSYSSTLEGYTFYVLASDSLSLDVITDSSGNVDKDTSFCGIGVFSDTQSSRKAFAGSIIVGGNGSTYLDIQNWPCVFNCISTKASITSLDSEKFLISSSRSSIVFSEYMYSDEDGTFNISGYKHNSTYCSGTGEKGFLANNIKGNKKTNIDLTNFFSTSEYNISSSSSYCGGIFGMVNNTGITITLELPTTLNINTSSSANDTGLLIGRINGGNSSVTINKNSDIVNISGTADVGNLTKCAGGICGYIESSSSLIMNGTYNLNVTVNGHFAGGCVGTNKGNFDVYSINLSNSTIVATANGSSTAGGLIGYIDYIGAFTIKNIFKITNTAIEGKGRLGGVIGYYKPTKPINQIIEKVSITSLVFNAASSDFASAGGFIGYADIHNGTEIALTINLKDEEHNITFNNNNNGTRCGGVFGYARTGVQANKISVKASDEATFNNTFNFNTTGIYAGGIAAEIQGGPGYSEFSNITLNNNYVTADYTKTGDLFSYININNHVKLKNIQYKRVSNQPSLALCEIMSGAVLGIDGYFKDLSDSQNNIVRLVTDALVFADDDFEYTHPSTVNGNDLGNQGQILRDDKLHIIEFDEATNKFKVNSQLNYSSKNVAINSIQDFAKLYIYYITNKKFNTLSGTPDTNFDEIITLNCDIDLTDIGIESLFPTNKVSFDRAFCGELNGNGHTITLDIGKNLSSGNNIILNQGNARRYFGLFTITKNAKFSNFTIYSSFKNSSSYNPENSFYGTICAMVGEFNTTNKSTTFVIDNVTSNSTIINTETSYNKYAWHGGLVGHITSTSCHIDNCTVDFNLTNVNKNVRYGVLVGECYLGNEASFSNNHLSGICNSDSYSQDKVIVGGLMAYLQFTSYTKVDLSGTEFDGIKIYTKASDSMGGILGYYYKNCEITLSTPVKDCIISSKGEAKIGGLAYQYIGKIILDENADKSERFEFDNCRIITSRTGIIGLMIYDGEKTYLSCRLDKSIFNGAIYNGNDISSMTNIDLFIASSKSSKSSKQSIINSGGLVTIETLGRTYGNNCGKYSDDTAKEWLDFINSNDGFKNNNTRYYFNIEELETKSYSANITNESDLMYFSVASFMHSTLRDWYFKASVTSINSNYDIDMTDRLFYPSSVSNISINFNNHSLTLNTNSFSWDTENQFRGIGAGLLLEVRASGANQTVSVSNLVCKGVFRARNNQGGFVICDVISGKKVDDTTIYTINVNISNIFFDNSLSKDDKKSPLLICAIDSYANATIDTVTQYTRATYNTANKVNTYTSTKQHETLIGDCGSPNNNLSPISTNVNVTLSNIVFDSNTSTSIFSKASLFRSIYYIAGTSSFKYNFNESDDHKNGQYLHNTTYGKELVLNEEQQKYYDSETIYVSSTTSKTSLDTSILDTTLFYVYCYESSKGPAATTTNYCIILSVNRKSVDLINGYGSFDNPYIIDNPLQLLLISNIISNKDCSLSNDWKINYPTSKTDYTGYKEYNYNGSKLLNGSTELSRADLQAHLQNAYYYIDGTLTMSSEFIGLGTASNPFHGVIVGGNNATIEMDGKIGIGSEGYGLVNVANGCAIYNITISYTDTLQMTSTEFSSTVTSSGPQSTIALSASPYFGGAIGFVCGGDNLIDSVTVTITAFNQNGASYSAAGGYVGVVTAGGVALYNLGNEGISDFASEDIAHFYYNPYVGKVTNGYVISLDENYDNTSKNFNINKLENTTINGTYTSSKLDFSITDANQLLIYSYAMNSGALAYNANQVGYGLNARNRIDGLGDYAYVGNNNSNTITLTNGFYKTDSFGTTTIAYLRKYFTSSSYLNNITGTNITISLTGSSYDMSSYKNGFRGIAGQFVSSIDYKIVSLTGTDSTDVKVDLSMKAYYGAKVEPDAMCSAGFIGYSNVEITIKNFGISGKIESLVYTYSSPTSYKSITVPKFSTSGSTANNKEIGFITVGGVIGTSNVNTIFDNVTVHDMIVSSSDTCAALIGDYYANGSTTTKQILTSGVTINNVNVAGTRFVGIVCGVFEAAKLTDYVFEDTVITNSTAIIDITSTPISLSAVGGFAGRVVNRSGKDNSLNFNSCSISDSAFIFSTSSESERANYKYYSGGFLGITPIRAYATDCEVLGCVVGAATNLAKRSGVTSLNYTDTNLSVTDTKYNKIQGIVSYLASRNNGDGNWYFGDASGYFANSDQEIGFTNCVLGDSENYSSIIYGLNNVGAFFGEHSRSTISLDNCHILSNYNRVILISSTRAGGLGGYQSAAAQVTMKNCKVVGTQSSKIYLVTANYSGGAGSGAAIGGINSNASLVVDGFESAYTNISSGYSSIICPKSNGVTTLSNLYLHDNYVQSTKNYSGAITLEINYDTYINSTAIINNFIVSKSNGVGLLAATNLTKSLYVNYLMVQDNQLGTRSTPLTHLNVLNDINELKTTSMDTNYAGYLVYNNASTLNVMGLSRMEQETPLFSGDYIKVDTGTSYIVNVAYGSIDTFVNAYGTDDELTVKEAIESVNYNNDSDYFYGDHMSNPKDFSGINYRENSINTTDLDEMLSTLSKEVDEGKTVNDNINLLLIKGDSNEYIKSYIEYLISEKLSDIPTTDISITTKKYYINDDGTLRASSDKGSVTYENGKFFVGTYDNLTGSSPCFTMISITFKNKCGASAYETYTMHIAIYYPQVLELETFIVPIDSENYSISAFKDRVANSANPYNINVSSGDTFSLYISYYYSSVASQIEEYNFGKSIHSTDIDTRVNDGKVFPVGTKFLLIDLNSSLPSGYKVYYYTLTSSTSRIEFINFKDSEGNDYPGCQKYLTELVKSNEKYLETYLMIVEFPLSSSSSDASSQYYIKADVGENDRNIIIDELYTSKLARVDIWKSPEIELDMDKNETNNDETIVLGDKYINEDVSASVTFPNLYIQSLPVSTKMYGTFTFQLKNNFDKTIKLPNNTKIKIYDENDTLLVNQELTNTTVYSYSIGDIISIMKSSSGNEFTYDLHVELDFSSCDPLEFTQTFDNAQEYRFVSTFYYSSSEKYYNTGQFVSDTSSYVAVVGDNIKLSVIPTVNKELSVNVNSIEKADKTNSGTITFKVHANFTACIDNMPTEAVYTFAIYKKVYEGGKHYYDTANDLLTDESSIAIILNGETDCTSGVKFDVVDGFSDGTLVLKLQIRDSDGNVLSNVNMANYELVVTVKGLDKTGKVVTSSETNNFIFQICDIMTEPK